MKRLVLLCLLLLGRIVAGDTNCFVAYDNGKVLKQEGDCTQRHSPCSTFKIVISLMGYNEKILVDVTTPEWPFETGYVDYLDIWKNPHNPTSWMQNSCIWYSQFITQKLGLIKFKEYVRKFDYGNQDLSGDKGLSNGLTHSWLSSSLEVSPLEQIKFLEKLVSNKLPVSLYAHILTRRLLFLEHLPNNWKLYGKTGGGYLLKADGSRDHERSIGWFIGWIEKNDRKIVFANFIQDTKKMGSSVGPRAKSAAKEKLKEFLE